MRTLVLNAGYEPMLLVNWQRAICLVLSEKAEIVAEYNKAVRTVSDKFQLPSVVRLTRYVRVVKRFGVARCTRKNIMLRDHFECQYCGVRCSKASASVDHIKPRSKGGKTVWNNVVVACHACNRKKASHSVQEIGFTLRSVPKTPTWRELIGEKDAYLEVAWLPYIDYAG